MGDAGHVRGFLLLAEAGLEVLVHFRGEDVLAAGVALLQELALLGLGDDLLLHALGHHRGMLLDARQQLAIRDVLALLRLEADGLDELEVVPVDVAFLGLLALLLLLPPRLHLLGNVVVVHQLAGLEDLLATLQVLAQPLHLLALHFQDVGICFHKLYEVGVALGGRPQELELRVVLLSLAQGHQEVLAVLGGVLGGVLDHRLLALAQLLRQRSDVLFRVRLLQLDEDLLEEDGLFGLGLGLWLGLFLWFHCFLNLGFLLRLLHADALNHLLADLCDPMVVVSPIGTLGLEEGELRLMLLSLDQYFFERRPVERHMLRRLFQ